MNDQLNQPTTDLGRAIRSLSNASMRYTDANAYYAGDHNLNYATDKFKTAFGYLFKTFALNLCPAICDAVRDKLIITEFRVEDGENGSGDIGTEAWQIWQANRMGKRSGEIHLEAVKCGDAYAIVWPDAAGRVTIYPNSAGQMTVQYDPETPGKVTRAAKYWINDDGRTRINIYYTDRTERYITKRATKGGVLPSDVKEWLEFEAPVPNPYGRVPVFHFANNSHLDSLGHSEIKAAIPLQDALNKSVLDMLIAMEFSAFRQRWITGIDVEMDDNGNAISPFVPGADRIWMTANENAKFGDFEAADLRQFLEVKDGFRVDMAAVTGTPLYYFMQTGGQFPSGEALQKAESRFINKVRDRMEAFGQVWEDLMSFALEIENKGRGVRLFAEWQDPAPLSEKEKLDNLITKQAIGVDETQLMIEAGYGEDDIKKMQDREAERRTAEAARFNAGTIVDPTVDPTADPAV